MLDAEHEIGEGDAPTGLPCGDPCRRRAGGEPVEPFSAVEEGNAHQRIRHGARQALDPHVLTGKRVDRRQPPGLHHRVVGRARDDGGRVLDMAREGDVQRQPRIAEHRRLEQHLENAWARLRSVRDRRAALHGPRPTGRQTGGRASNRGGSTRPIARGSGTRDHGLPPGLPAGVGPMASSMTTPYFSRSLPR